MRGEVDINLEAVRAFVTVAEQEQFQLAADHPAASQQAVSKRLATLEADLGVRLLKRSAGGTRLTIDGQAFLPHAAVDGVRGSHVGQCGARGDRVRRDWTTYIADRVSTPPQGIPHDPNKCSPPVLRHG